MLEEFPDATIFRPSEMYGEKDTFLNYYFNWARWGFWGNMPMYRKGNFTTKRPLFYADLGDGIMAALETPGKCRSDSNYVEASHRIFHCKFQLRRGWSMKRTGKWNCLCMLMCAVNISNILRRPQAFLLSEIMDWMCEKTNRDPKDYNYGRSELIYSPYALAKTLVIERLPTGQKKAFGPQTLEKLERVSSLERLLAASCTHRKRNAEFTFIYQIYCVFAFLPMAAPCP